MTYTPKQIRLLNEATQQEYADKMGVHVQTYRKMESHPEEMTIGQAKLFSNISGYPMEAINFASNI